ncbi:MAG TPA: TOBE domain-containing protein [Burkholderiaceae bacterium]|jgi:molybdopterin-binding protein
MNRLSGHIAAIAVEGSIALVDVAVGTRLYTAMLLGAGADDQVWRPGAAVTLVFKETEVALARNLSGAISLRNRLQGIVSAIEKGRLLSRVIFTVDGMPVSSVITTRSLDGLQLEVGAAVEGLVKSNEMSVVLEGGV